MAAVGYSSAHLLLLSLFLQQCHSDKRDQDGKPNNPTRRPNARPSCTHVDMDRVYGEGGTCSLCKRIPSIGFLYSCQCDIDAQTTGLNTTTSAKWTDTRELSKYATIRDTFRSNRKRLQKQYPKESDRSASAEQLLEQMSRLGYNETVLKAAAGGHYSTDQLRILIEQKLQVKHSIKATIREYESLRSKNRPSPAPLGEKLPPFADSLPPTVSSETAVESKPTFATRSVEQHSRDIPAQKPQRSVSRACESCAFDVCHTCRPLSRDRSYTSFRTIMNGELRLTGKHVARYMPVHNIHTVRNLGIRPSPSPMVANIGVAISDPETLESDIDDFESHSSSSSSDYAQFAPRHGTHLSLQQALSCNIGTTGDAAEDEATEPGSPRGTIPLGGHSMNNKPSSFGFRESLARDLHNLILRAWSQSHFTGRDLATGLDRNTLERLVALYRTKRGQMFDLDLWRALAECLLEEAASTPLPPEDNEAEEIEIEHLQQNSYNRPGGTARLQVNQVCKVVGLPNLSDAGMKSMDENALMEEPSSQASLR